MKRMRVARLYQRLPRVLEELESGAIHLTGTFVDEQGRRCSEKRFISIEHRDPFALGGPPTVENLCLLCTSHNAHAARRVFGEAYVEERRLEDEVYRKTSSALVGLGFERKQAKAALEVAARVRHTTRGRDRSCGERSPYWRSERPCAPSDDQPACPEHLAERGLEPGRRVGERGAGDLDEAVAARGLEGAWTASRSSGPPCSRTPSDQLRGLDGVDAGDGAQRGEARLGTRRPCGRCARADRRRDRSASARSPRRLP